MPSKRSPLFRTSQSRVWLIPSRAGPANEPEYQSYARAAAFSWQQGATRPIRNPSDDNYGDFVVIDEIVGQAGLPQLNVEFRATRARSEILAMTRNGCPFDIQLHIGACKSPTDFDFGWEKILVLEGGRLDNYGNPDLGAFDRDQENPVAENTQITGLDWYEINPILGSEVAASSIINPVVAVSICDSKTCGDCGVSSDGCQIVLAVAKAASGSPGLPAQVVLTSDGGSSFDTSVITTLAANREPVDGTCVGTLFAVISNTDDALHYASIQDLIDGEETWVKVTSGIVAAGSPNAIFSLGRVFTWMAGDGGYIYFSNDVTAGFETQTEGSVTVENLKAIHGLDDKLNLVAVGENNAVLKTANGGRSWAAITGPNPAVVLNTVWMQSENEWLVGDAAGNLWYTLNSGKSWTAKAFTGSGSGAVYSVRFPTTTVGYMAHSTHVLRTVNGGQSWYRLPEEEGISFPSATSYNAIGVCPDDHNLVWAGGVDGTDGILVKAA